MIPMKLSCSAGETHIQNNSRRRCAILRHPKKCCEKNFRTETLLPVRFRLVELGHGSAGYKKFGGGVDAAESCQYAGPSEARDKHAASVVLQADAHQYNRRLHGHQALCTIFETAARSAGPQRRARGCWLIIQHLPLGRLVVVMREGTAGKGMTQMHCKLVVVLLLLATAPSREAGVASHLPTTLHPPQSLSALPSYHETVAERPRDASHI
ncbi:hypothetical protein BDZ89DRAFT_1041489 [Hymenopellis radicata]|nr:hypothetical protein BDZ89DRAFT_1041489 [Hymenopellis radicata]